MSNILTRFIKGIILKSQSSDPSEVEEGALFSVTNPTNRIKAYIEGASREVITNTQSQTLQNKLIIASENSIQVSATGVTSTELNAALQEIQGNVSAPDSTKANTNLNNLVTTSIPSGVNLESVSTDTSFSTGFQVKTKDQGTPTTTNNSNSGAVRIISGNVSGNYGSGGARVWSGSNFNAQRATPSTTATGPMTFLSGDITGGTQGSTGNILINSGNIYGASVSGNTGPAFLATGVNYGIGDTGRVDLTTGDADQGNSGDVNITTGIASGTRGKVNLNASSIDVNSSQIKELANGTDSTDAVNLSQLNKKQDLVDVLFNQTFEFSSLTDFTHTGLTLTQTDPLHGTVSALLTHQSAINQSFKQIIPVDRKFRGQTMVLRLDSKSSASQGNVTIKIYDETNSANIVASEQLQLSNDVNGKKTSVGFTIPETCASISYTITALPEAGSPTTRIDDIICELAETALLETAVVVPNVTAWQGYTPTFQGFGTAPTGPTNIEFEWRQVGENVEIRGKFTSGTSTAVEARVGLPAGLTSAGTSIIPSIQPVGLCAANIATTANAANDISTLIEPSVSYVTFRTPGSSSLTKANASQISGSGISFSFFASVPCAGLSASRTKTIALTQSGLVQEDDSYLKAEGGSGQSLTANVTNISFGLTTLSGTALSYDGSSVTVLESGIYTFTGSIRVTVAQTNLAVQIFKNGVSFKKASIDYGSVTMLKFDYCDYLAAGDVISFRSSLSATATTGNPDDHYLNVTKQGSLKQVSVNPNSKITIPTSELRFEGASARGTTDTTIVRFDNISKLRGDAFTVESDAVLGTRITMKKDGLLTVSSNMYANASRQVSITKNQANRTTDPVASEILASEYALAGDAYSLSYTGFVLVGDVIRVYMNAAPTANPANNLNLSFQEQEIAVSVTNTLPQFSESDSSVRVNTANGYGSTLSNKIRRFSSTVENLGSDISYVDDPANGATFTVLSSGIYNISYTDQFSAQCLMGISKNASSLTSAIQSLAASQILAVANSVSLNQPESVSWQGYLVAGDIIRPHSEGTSAGTTTSAVSFTISKVGKPNVTGVDITPFVNVPQPQIQSRILTSSSAITTTTNLSTLTTTRSSGSSIFELGSTGIRILKPCTISVSLSCSKTSSTLALTYIYLNGSNDIYQISRSATSTSNNSNASVTYNVVTGDLITFESDGNNYNIIAISATALSDQILTAPETFSTDTASLKYVAGATSNEATLANLANASIGSYTTFTYAGGSNSRSFTTTRPTQTDADMNTNGILIYTRIYNLPSSAAQPACVAIQIGKGLKGLNLGLYKSSGKNTAGDLDLMYIQSSEQRGMSYKNYNEVTGILLLDAGETITSSITTSRFFYIDQVAQTSGYLVINASKNPALTGLNVLQPRIATVSITGGTPVSGSFATRTLSTSVSDPSGIGVSVASNQITLSRGEYYIQASASHYRTGTSRSRIQNITTSTTAIDGVGTELSTTVTGFVDAIGGYVVVPSTQVFEHQSFCNQASASWVQGGSTIAGFIKITKVK